MKDFDKLKSKKTNSSLAFPTLHLDWLDLKESLSRSLLLSRCLLLFPCHISVLLFTLLNSPRLGQRACKAVRLIPYKAQCAIVQLWAHVATHLIRIVGTVLHNDATILQVIIAFSYAYVALQCFIEVKDVIVSIDMIALSRQCFPMTNKILFSMQVIDWLTGLLSMAAQKSSVLPRIFVLKHCLAEFGLWIVKSCIDSIVKEAICLRDTLLLSNDVFLHNFLFTMALSTGQMRDFRWFWRTLAW